MPMNYSPPRKTFQRRLGNQSQENRLFASNQQVFQEKEQNMPPLDSPYKESSVDQSNTNHLTPPRNLNSIQQKIKQRITVNQQKGIKGRLGSAVAAARSASHGTIVEPAEENVLMPQPNLRQSLSMNKPRPQSSRKVRVGKPNLSPNKENTYQVSSESFQLSPLNQSVNDSPVAVNKMMNRRKVLKQTDNFPSLQPIEQSPEVPLIQASEQQTETEDSMIKQNKYKLDFEIKLNNQPQGLSIQDQDQIQPPDFQVKASMKPRQSIPPVFTQSVLTKPFESFLMTKDSVPAPIQTNQVNQPIDRKHNLTPEAVGCRRKTFQRRSVSQPKVEPLAEPPVLDNQEMQSYQCTAFESIHSKQKNFSAVGIRSRLKNRSEKKFNCFTVRVNQKATPATSDKSDESLMGLEDDSELKASPTPTDTHPTFNNTPDVKVEDIDTENADFRFSKMRISHPLMSTSEDALPTDQQDSISKSRIDNSGSCSFNYTKNSETQDQISQENKGVGLQGGSDLSHNEDQIVSRFNQSSISPGSPQDNQTLDFVSMITPDSEQQNLIDCANQIQNSQNEAVSQFQIQTGNQERCSSTPDLNALKRPFTYQNQLVVQNQQSVETVETHGANSNTVILSTCQGRTENTSEQTYPTPEHSSNKKYSPKQMFIHSPESEIPNQVTYEIQESHGSTSENYSPFNNYQVFSDQITQSTPYEEQSPEMQTQQNNRFHSMERTPEQCQQTYTYAREGPESIEAAYEASPDETGAYRNFKLKLHLMEAEGPFEDEQTFYQEGIEEEIKEDSVEDTVEVTPTKASPTSSNPFYSGIKQNKQQYLPSTKSKSPALPKIIVSCDDNPFKQKCSSFMEQTTKSKKRVMAISPSKKMLLQNSEKKLAVEEQQLQALKRVRPMFLSRSQSRERLGNETPTFAARPRNQFQSTDCKASRNKNREVSEDRLESKEEREAIYESHGIRSKLPDPPKSARKPVQGITLGRFDTSESKGRTPSNMSRERDEKPLFMAQPQLKQIKSTPVQQPSRNLANTHQDSSFNNNSDDFPTTQKHQTVVPSQKKVVKKKVKKTSSIEPNGKENQHKQTNRLVIKRDDIIMSKQISFADQKAKSKSGLSSPKNQTKLIQSKQLV